MQTNDKLAALDDAIQKASQLNQEADRALEKAIKSATGDMSLEDDYRYKYAQQLQKVYVRASAVSGRYFLAQRKNSKKSHKT
jgi:hypothetical protein